jgi:hypothetical protein
MSASRSWVDERQSVQTFSREFEMTFLILIAVFIVPIALADIRRGYRPFDRIPTERNTSGS